MLNLASQGTGLALVPEPLQTGTALGSWWSDTLLGGHRRRGCSPSSLPPSTISPASEEVSSKALGTSVWAWKPGGKGLVGVSTVLSQESGPKSQLCLSCCVTTVLVFSGDLQRPFSH